MSHMSPSQKFEANDSEMRPVTAPNNMRNFEMPPESYFFLILKKYIFSDD